MQGSPTFQEWRAAQALGAITPPQKPATSNPEQASSQKKADDTRPPPSYLVCCRRCRHQKDSQEVGRGKRQIT